MRSRLPLNLTSRLVISHLIIGILSIGLISSIAAYFILDRGRNEVESFLEDTAFLVANNLEQPMMEANGDTSQLASVMSGVLGQFFSERPEIHYYLFQTGGKLLVTNDNQDPSLKSTTLPPEVLQALEGVDGDARRLEENGQEAFYVAIPISHDNVIYGALRLSVVYAEQMSASYRTLALLAAIAFLLILAVIAEAWWMASTISRPIRSLTDVADQLSQGKLLVRAVPSGPEELHQLAMTLNQMASHLEDNMEGLRAFVANASHELRTPITAIRLHVEALSSGAMEDPEVSQRFLSQIQDELELMDRTVTDLLDLSRIEAGRGNTKYEPVDLGGVIGEMHNLWRVRAQQNSLELRVNIAPSAPKILGNEDQLLRLVNNLLENAIKNTPPGGWVELNLLNLPEKSSVRLEVRDNGIGIAEEHIPRIFERFYRVEPTQLKNKKISGSGLGLAIAKSIVEAHGGKIGVLSKVGVGSTFWVEFPAAKLRFDEKKTQPGR
jgi:two-component system sensor histidine kinase SaeS